MFLFNSATYLGIFRHTRDGEHIRSLVPPGGRKTDGHCALQTLTKHQFAGG